jgi:siroheme synthase-like protein
VVAEAHQRGILVGRADADEDDSSDFVTPAVLRLGAVVVAVSAAGSAALAAALRDRVSGSLSDDWINLAGAMQRLRPTIKSSGLPIGRRREIFKALATDEAAAQNRDGIQELWDWTRKKFPELPQLELNSSIP